MQVENVTLVSQNMKIHENEMLFDIKKEQVRNLTARIIASILYNYISNFDFIL